MMIGTTLSHYAIEAELGRGGMGIVYKARDTKLDRDVAIKVLPSAALASADDRERFYREAKSAAQLHHPNIASVFEIDEAVPSDAPHGTQPSPFIAMEFISGETLQDMVREGPLKLSDAVKMASQVAEALKAAHAKNIVHRDIKSANVMVTEDGAAKVLDFGLAKTNQSTMLTRMGSTLGTVAYMSPEQARGQEVDSRSDLYSLGTMLYEMVAGRLPFAGDYEQAVVYSILNEPPEPLTSLRTGVPMDLERIVNKLLSKDADYRYQSATDLLVDLKSLDLSGSGHSRRSMPATSTAVPSATLQGSRSSILTWVIAAGTAGLVLGALLVWFFRPQPQTPELPLVTMTTPADDTFYFAYWNSRKLAMSSDGSLVASAHSGGIQLMRLDDPGNWTTLKEERQGIGELAFSPDGKWISYWDFPSRRLMKASVSGGASRPLFNSSEIIRSVRVSHWAADGFIYFVASDEDRTVRLARVSSEGGPVDYLTDLEVESEVSIRSVHLLPGGRFLLYSTTGQGEELLSSEIWAYDVRSGISHVVTPNGSAPVYLPTGHLVYYSGSLLMAAVFDPDSARLIGESEQVSDKVWSTGPNPPFAISSNGILIKLRGEFTGTNASGSTPAWVEPSGSITPWNPDRKQYQHVEVSPDGSQAFLLTRSGGSRSARISLMNTTLGTTEFNRTGGSPPVWHPDGDHYALSDETGTRIIRTSLSNPAVVDTLFRSDGQVEPTDWSADGATLIFNSGDLLATDIRVLDVETGQDRFFRQSAGDDDYAQLSPNGEWIAYETGSGQDVSIVIQRFPSGTDRFVAAENAAKVRWHPNGTRIFTIAENGRLNSVDLDLAAGKGGPLVEVTNAFMDRNWQFDVHPVSGRPVILAQSTDWGDTPESDRVWDIYVNWFTTLPKPE